jgi:hypothetical protein
MLKRIPKSDISIRPFKAFKQWNFNQDSNEISLLEANESPAFNPSDITSDGGLSFYKHSLYGQLKAQFYNGNEYNPFTLVGSISPEYDDSVLTKDRYLNGYAKVVSIPEIYIGEGIKKGSFLLVDGDGYYSDDTYGNIIATDNSKIGNLFYQQGLVVITRNAESALTGSWNIQYKSTETIYENEVLLIVSPDEFNVSTNPSAILTVGEVSENFVDDAGVSRKVIYNPGAKYIRKLSTLDNGTILDYRYTSSIDPTVKAGFEQYDYSSSIDTTGSFLAPFITTIGLYDDNCDLVAVAKVPQPIKSYSDLPVNFIIRFDY